MAEAHQTEAAVQGRPYMGGRRRCQRWRQVLVVLVAMVALAVVVGLLPVSPRMLDVAARLRARATVFGGSMAGVVEVFSRLVQTLPVGALEEAHGVEGTPALEIFLAAPRTEGPQRHCWSQR